jgi:hypothetical protein
VANLWTEIPERSYPPPPAFVEAKGRQDEVSAADARLAVIAACPFRYSSGFIQTAIDWQRRTPSVPVAEDGVSPDPQNKGPEGAK